MSPTSDKDYYYWNKGEKFPLGTQAFYSTEFDCPCKHDTCIRQRVSKDLIQRLLHVRTQLAAPINVNSGFRCEQHQADLAAKGYETAKGVSQHQLGNAADIRAESMNALLQVCTQSFHAIGVANTFIHVDTRDDKDRRWSYSHTP